MEKLDIEAIAAEYKKGGIGIKDLALRYGTNFGTLRRRLLDAGVILGKRGPSFRMYSMRPGTHTPIITGSGGYQLEYVPDHPRANRQGRVAVHTLVAEQALGRYLPPGAVIHHVDGDVRNNSANNLVICQNQAYHLLLHQRAYKLGLQGPSFAR